METSLPTPMTARVYVKLPDGNHKDHKVWYLWSWDTWENITRSSMDDVQMGEPWDLGS